MAVIVIVGVKDGTGINKLINKYAVMLNSLLSLICFLPSVDSSDDFYKNATTIIGVTLPVTKLPDDKEKKLSTLEKAGIVITAIVGILTVISAFLAIHCHKNCPPKGRGIPSWSTPIVNCWSTAGKLLVNCLDCQRSESLL